ncbi:amine oxidase [flavin-containing]-like [Branchiostoma lanceolatum]|uniref:amine oxidase [flavin-containing]-like n=1 Tax=Branchiostoma lanceolatum TaxID=7740 RepID=UPI003452E05A
MATGRTKTQVVIVGAGLSGLSAAKVLHEYGVESIVLEARDRVGGRTHTIKGPGFGYADVGGAYIGPTQNHILKLVKELGIQMYKVNTEGMSAVWRKGKKFTVDSEQVAVTNPVCLLDLQHLFRTMDRMGAEIPVEAPWKAPHAKEWDRLTMKDVFDKLIWTGSVRRFADMFVHVNVTSEPHEISALWFLWYIRQCGGVKRIFSVANGGQERKLVGGTQQISLRLAELLGNRVTLNSSVSKVTQTEMGISIDTLSGDSYQAEYSIVAIPPPLQLRVSFSPSLPPVRNQMIQRMPMGSVIKTMMYYEKAYWTEKGMSGMGVIENDDCPVEFTLDDTKPDGSYPAIIGFVPANKARRYSNYSEDERRDLICQGYAKTFGLKELLHPTCYVEKNWLEEPYSGGCYTTALPPGVLTQFGRIVREPFGRVFFAGTETATHWSGYMEGAVQAGERAAREILHAMGKIEANQVWQDAPQSEEVPALPFVDSFVETYSPSISGLLSTIGLTAVVGLAVGASFILYNK